MTKKTSTSNPSISVLADDALVHLRGGAGRHPAVYPRTGSGGGRGEPRTQIGSGSN